MTYYPVFNDPDDIDVTVKYSNGSSVGGVYKIKFEDLPDDIKLKIRNQQIEEVMKLLREPFGIA